VGAGPVDIFASSGGAVNALALVARHPGQVRTLVAHEPPAFRELPDSEQMLAVCVDMHDTYLRSGFGPAMAKFIAVISVPGPIPSDYLDRPAPDPAAFGLPTEDDGSRNDPLVGQNMVSCAHYEHDFDAIRAASTRVVLAVGEESSQMVAGRAGVAVAGRLGLTPARRVRRGAARGTRPPTAMTYTADPRVDAYIDALPAWQRDTCREVRALVHAADPEVTETVKRTNRPYFVLQGNVCALLAASDHVNVFLYDGAIVPDPEGIITAGHDNKTARTVAFRQGEPVNAPALTEMFRQIIANNRAGGWRKIKSKAE